MSESLSTGVMMPSRKSVAHSQESQSMEWKWSWQDEYLKWLCGYANTDGGTLYIGVNDDGYVVGVKDPKTLLEILPNKITKKLGIVASIVLHKAVLGRNLRYGSDVPVNISSKLINRYSCGLLKSVDLPEEDTRLVTLSKLEKETPLYADSEGVVEYIEISVPRYPFAISCDGRYYKRSGSTLHELNGFELQSFLLERAGLTWDGVAIPDVDVSELSREALDRFRRKAVSKGRMTEEEASAPDIDILRNLKLIDKGNLTRAALLMFHPDPEQFVVGSYIKIGFFAPAGAYGQNKVDDIIYSDDVQGPLLLQVDKALDLIYTKYLKALISYSGLQRIETFLWPREAFREVLLNAVNHKRYEKGIPIQIRVYEDKILVFNDGVWPSTIDVDKIYDHHPSLPYNPLVANVSYRAGDIEAWGSGYEKIRIECEKAKAPYPIIHANPNGGVEIECQGCELYMKLLKHGRFYDTYPQEDAESKPETADNEHQKAVDRMLDILSRNLTEKEKGRILPIVEFLKVNDSITRKKAMEITGKGKSVASDYLKKLVELDVLVSEGQTNNLYYRIKNRTS